MSKAVKSLELETLRQTFTDVRDLVVLSVKGLSAQGEYGLRATLRKKNIRVRTIKNTLTRVIFEQFGMPAATEVPFWSGPTSLAWGAGSIAELSREIETELKDAKKAPQYKDKISIKGAVADGVAVTFELALKMPTRAEAIGRVVTLALSPASRVVSQILGPASRVASQINTVRDKEDGAEADADAAAPAPASA